MSEPKPSRLPLIAVGSAILAVVVSVVAAIIVLVRDDEPSSAHAKMPLIDRAVSVDDIIALRDKVEVVVESGMPQGLRVTDLGVAKLLGLEDKDVLTALLGRKLTSETDLSSVITRARLLHSTTLYAEILRNGAPLVMRWQLDKDLFDAPRTPPGNANTPPPVAPDPNDVPLKNPFADPGSSPGSSGDPVLDAIQTVDDTHIRVPKKTFEALLANPAAYAKGARIVASVKNGDLDGYKIYAIRPDALFARLGFQNGDAVHTINGARLADVDDVVSLINDAKNKTPFFRFDITRRGKPLQLEIEITP